MIGARYTEERRPVWRSRLGEIGSVLLLALFVCLACAVLCLSLGCLVRLSGGIRVSEDAGRGAVARATAIFTEARDHSLGRWGEEQVFESSGGAAVAVRALDPLEPWRMGVEAEIPTSGDGLRRVAAQWCSCTVERGLDGLDLPAAALVAELCLASIGRAEPVVTGAVSSVTPAFLSFPDLSADLSGVPVRRLVGRWELDEGTRTHLKALRGLGGNVVILEGNTGQCLTVDPISAGIGVGVGRAPDNPVLVVVMGGADAVLAEWGEVCGVVVVDGGSLVLEGTSLVGAAFVSRNIDMGETGALTFHPGILRWATDSSLPRVRLVPGTRSERWRE